MGPLYDAWVTRMQATLSERSVSSPSELGGYPAPEDHGLPWASCGKWWFQRACERKALTGTRDGLCFWLNPSQWLALTSQQPKLNKHRLFLSRYGAEDHVTDHGSSYQKNQERGVPCEGDRAQVSHPDWVIPFLGDSHRMFLRYFLKHWKQLLLSLQSFYFICL